MLSLPTRRPSPHASRTSGVPAEGQSPPERQGLPRPSAQSGSSWSHTRAYYHRGVGSKGNSADATSPGISALQGATFVSRQSAPHPYVLAGVHGPCQAGLNDRTAAADDFCLFDLKQRGIGVPDGKEQFGTHVQAGSTIAPSQQDRIPRTEI